MPEEQIEDKDLFEDAFGEDSEKKEALKRLKEKLAQKEEAKKPIKEKTDSKEDEDEDEELEEDEEDKVSEPQIFGEPSAPSDFESKDEAFENMDAGGKKKTNSKNNFEDIVEDGLEKSIENAKEDPKNIKKEGKGYGGKLDLKVTIDEDEEEDSKPTPIERKIIKSVIKNKAMMSAKQDIKINKVKLNENVPHAEETHDEMADAMLREEGTKEEGLEIKENNTDDNEDDDKDKRKMPKAQLPEDEEEEETTADGKIKPSLEFLTANSGHAYIGRKKSVLSQYGEEGGLFVGRVTEKDKQGTDIYLDGLNPHVVFVCGARGSGKSYVLGVVAEELAIKNKNVGIVVVDPIGVFWSMKHPNKEAKELELLAKWDLMPRGLNNIKVFIPVGMKDSVPKSTYDAVFSIQPSLLTAEDWCLTFGIDRFSPTGLLMEKGIAKVKSGYTTIDGKEVRGKQNTFSLVDLVKCFEDDAELNDKDKGYKADSIRALVSRFDAAKNWGIFDDKGTSLGLLSRAGQMTILDTSFLDDSVSALVVGIFARRILAARKLGTRREAAGQFETEADITELVELNIPPTWLFIDEAHTLIPGGNQKTPASSALVEYVKQGRRPGCSLVFATQQPSAIDSRVLSQLDIIMAHKLVFDDDIKAIYKRTPTIVPGAYRKSNFIKTLPIGNALTGDRSETTSRAFVMNIRPRMSQHEGRDAETVEVKQEMDTDKVENLAVNIVKRQLEKDPSIRIESVQETIDTLNNTYKKSITLATIMEMLNKNGIVEKEGKVFTKKVLEEIEEEARTEKEKEMELEEDENPKIETEHSQIKGQKKLPKEVLEFENDLSEIEEHVELTALKNAIDESQARKILLGMSEKKFLFIENEILDRVTLKHAQIYKVRYKYFSHKDAFHEGEAFINSLTGEFIHDDRGTLKESKGLPILLDLSEAETTVLKLVAEKKRTAKETAALMRMEEGNAKRVLDTLVKKGLIGRTIDERKIEFYTHGKVEMELPPTPLHEILSSIGKRPITEVDSAVLIQPIVSEKEIPDLLKKLWGSVTVKEITHLFLPVWEGVLKKKTGEERIVLIDGINGKPLKSLLE